MTTEWTDFFAEHGFFVGVSLDGPERFHDQTRLYGNGAGSFFDVMRGIDILRRADVFNGIICGVSKANHQFPRELLDFFIGEKIKKLKFARVKSIGHCADVSSFTILPSEYADFMIAIFDRWLELDDIEVEIRDIQSVISLLLGGSQRECIYLGQCDQFATVYADGSIHGCDSFPKSSAMNFGTVWDEPFAVKSHPRLEIFRGQIAKRNERCKICDWHHICKGGCAKDCYKHLGSIEPIEDMCVSLRRYFTHISTRLKSHGLIA